MKPFTVLSIIVFSVVALLQLTRLVLGWEVSIDRLAIPLWASGIALIVSGGLAFMLWRESRTTPPERSGP
jgi:hypothetical protein